MEYLFDLFSIINSSIYGYIFVPFAVCNLVYVLSNMFVKNQTLNKSISYAEKIFYTSGIVYIIVFVLNTLVIILNYNEYDIFGKYALSYWPQASIWILASQLLRFDFIKKFSLFRILISIFILISIEYYIILGATIARDYPAVEWSKIFKPGFVYAILFAKSFLFGFFCYAFVLRNIESKQDAILDEEIF